MNLFQIPQEIAKDLEEKGVKFKHVIKEKTDYRLINCEIFKMSYKYIILQDNVQ